jgi:hypothetical protein
MNRKLACIALIAFALCPAASALGITTVKLTAIASPGGVVEKTEIQDTATLSGTTAATGTLTFLLYGPGDPRCESSAIQTSTKPAEGNGKYSSEAFFPFTVGTYNYVVRYSGDAQNAPASTTCGEPGQSVTITSATPSLATLASNAAEIGQGIFDSARLLRGAEPSGDVTFDLYGPGDPTCTQAPIATYIIPSTGFEQRYRSPTYTALAEGMYHWIASYGGDSRNLPVTGACGDEGESVFVSGLRIPATIGVRASPPTAVGGPITATATITAPAGAAGTLTFSIFGPNNEKCVNGALIASTRVISSNGEYASDPFVPSSPGVYRFVVTYNANDGSSAATECSTAGDAVTVSPLEPPVLDRSFTVTPVSGKVFVQVHPAAAVAAAKASRIGFIEIHAPRNVPMGSVIDTSSGTAKLITATTGSRRQSGTFNGTHFAVRQRAFDRGAVELDMRVDALTRSKDCRRVAHGARVARQIKLPPKYISRLNAKVEGQFRTRGRYSSASAHGTSWQMAERCDGTRTEVFTDAVTVTDFRLHRTVLVRAGKHYLARR